MSVSRPKISEDTQVKLLKAASNAFIEKGFHNTKVSDIVSAAGVAQGTFYLYFKNKQDVLHKLVSGFMEQMSAKLQHYCQDKKDIMDIDQIKEADVAFLVDLFQWLEAEQQVVKLLLGGQYGIDGALDNCSTRLRETLVQISKESLYNCLENRTSRQLNTDLVAWAIVGMIENLAFQRFVCGRFKDMDIQEFAKEITDLKLFGISGFFAAS